jgi:O-antigen ligase
MWAAVLVTTLVSGILFPSFAVMDEVHPGAWAGGWWEKNQLGGHAARAVFLFAFLAWRDAAWRRGWIGALVVGLSLVALSKSATALLSVLVGFGVLASASWMVRGWKRSILFIWLGVSVVSALALTYAVAPGALLALIGRDATLTGRTDIWAQLIDAIRQKPWLGYGYQAFWGVDSEPRYWLQKAVEWLAPSGHNGWLDLAVSLGLIGVGLFALDLVMTLVRATRATAMAPVGVVALGMIAQFLLFSMSESIILFQNSIIWLTYVMVSVKLALDGAGVRSRSSTAFPAKARVQGRTGTLPA